MTRWLLVVLALLMAAPVSAQGTFSARFGSVPGSDNPDQPPTINVTSPAPPGLGITTAPQTLMGVAGDDLGIASVTCTVNTGSSCTVVGTFTWTATVGAGPAFTVGANIVTITATDTKSPTPQTTSTTFTYTYAAPPDPTPPVVTITTNGGLPITTTSSSYSLQGTCTDNVGCVSVKYILDGGAETNCSNTASWTCNNIPLTVAAHTVGVKGYDAAGNSHTDTISITRTASACAMSLVITPTGPVTDTTNDFLISGTAQADCGINQVRCGTDSFTDSWEYARHQNTRPVNGANYESSPGVPNPYPTTPVTFNTNHRRLKFGTNTYACWLEDNGSPKNTLKSNEITITYNKAAGIITTKAPPVQAGVAMQAWDLIPDGGAGAYSWDNQAGGSSLGAAACTGLTITNATVSGIVVGRISGTPTTTGTCSAPVRVTAGTSASATISITVQAGALPGANAHWDVMNALCNGVNCTKLYAVRMNQASDVTTYTGTGGGGTNCCIVAGTNYATVTWPVLADTTSSDSFPTGSQLYFPVNKTSGRVMFQFDILYTDSWLPYNCRPGGRNVFYNSNMTHKAYQFRMREVGGSQNTIFFETRTQFNREDNDLNNCTFISKLDNRLYHNKAGRPSGVVDAEPQDPTGTGALTNAPNYQMLPNAWTTITIETELNLDQDDFPEWELLTGGDLTTEAYHAQSVWAQNEYETTAQTVLFRVPEPAQQTLGVGVVLAQLFAPNIEFNTSSPTGSTHGGIPMIMLIRNFSVIYNYTFSDPANPTNDTTIFQRPYRN